MRFGFCFLALCSFVCNGHAVSVNPIGPGEIVVDGEYADLTEFSEVEYYDPSFDPPPYEAYSNTHYSLRAYAYFDWWVPDDEGYTFGAYGENLPAGMTVTVEPSYGGLEISWQAPYVSEPTDYTFRCGVDVLDGDTLLERLERVVTVTVKPSLPKLSTDAGTRGVRLRDPEFYSPSVWVNDPDESPQADALQLIAPDPRIIFTDDGDPDDAEWELRWNEAWPMPVASEVIPLRFRMRDFDGSGTRWTQAEAELLVFGHHYEDARIAPPEPQASGHFGAAVEVAYGTADSPTTAFIASENHAVHIYEETDFQSWALVQSLANPKTDLSFGSSIAATGDWLAIGAPSFTQGYPGRVFIYKRDASDGRWHWVQTLVPDEAEHALVFGGDVAITATDGSPAGHHTLMVSADGAHSNGSHTGAAWVFDLDAVEFGGTGLFEKKQVIVPEEAEAYDYFSWPLALNGDIAVLPANEDDDAATNSGAVYVYRRSGDTGFWELQQKLKASDPDEDALFGERVAVSEQGIFISALLNWGPGERAGAGAVYHFKEIDGVWEEQPMIRTVEEPSLARFGSSLAAEGGTILVAARRLGAGWPGFGRSVVFHFEWDEIEQTWQEVRTLCGSETDTPDSGEWGKLFGEAQALALSGDTVLVGDFGSDAGGFDDAGLAYTYFSVLRPVPPSHHLNSFFEDLQHEDIADAEKLADGDADHDGVANLIEFFQGTDPLRATPSSLALSVDGSGAVFADFWQHKNPSGLRPTLYYSRTLEEGAWTLLDAPVFLPDIDHGDYLSRRVDLSELNDGSGSFFIKMEILEAQPESLR